MAKGKAKTKSLKKAVSSTEPDLEQPTPKTAEDDKIEEPPPAEEAKTEEETRNEETSQLVEDSEANFEDTDETRSKNNEASEASLKKEKGKKGKKEKKASQVSLKKSKTGSSIEATGDGKEDEEPLPAEDKDQEEKPIEVNKKEPKKKKGKGKKKKEKTSTTDLGSEKSKKKKEKASTTDLSEEKSKEKITEASTTELGEGEPKKKKSKMTATEVDEEGVKKKKSKMSTSEVGDSKPKKKREEKDKKSKRSKSKTKTKKKEKQVKKSESGIGGKKKKKGKKAKKSATSGTSLGEMKKSRKLKKTASFAASVEDVKKKVKSTSSIRWDSSSLVAKDSPSKRSARSSSLLLRRRSSQWSYVGSDESEDSDYSYEDVIVESKTKSSVSIKTGLKKKKKGKKEQKAKKKKAITESETSEETEPDDKKKKKKGKKRKKEEKEADEEIEPQDDVLAEITRMKYLAELASSGEEVEEEESEPAPKKKKKSKKKKGPKKKLSKKEKARLAAEQAEKARINAEEEAIRAAELERIRLAEERKAAIEKEKREGFEQQIRMEQLEVALENFNELLNFNRTLRAKAKEKADWDFYVSCKRLPNPSKCDQMNTFLHLWENMIEETSMEEAAKRTVDMLELLNELDDLIDTAESEDSELVKNWKWVRLLFRQQQAKSLDVATYRLLRNIEKNLNRIDIPTADYKYQDENIVLCLWLRIQLPTPLPNPRRPAKPRIEVDFPQMKLEVQFPLSIDGEKTAVRALYVKYDHLSDLSATHQKPLIPKDYDIGLYEAMKQEWREKLLYKYNNRIRKTPDPPPPNENGGEGEASQEAPPEDVIGPDDDVPIVPYQKLEPTASEYVIGQEENLYGNIRAKLVKCVPDDVVNLRKYSIIGGIYSLNLVHQPPQPQDFVTLEMNLTPLYLPKQLELVDIYLEYNPPPPSDPLIRRPPEEIEEEMKKLEEELEKLILITLTWPEHVIFLELPMVCYWDQKRQIWSKSEVYDLKHNEEKAQLSFRVRKGGTFALAIYRYANLPYQAWELRPEANGTISLQITAAILMVEFNVKDGLIALSQLQNSPNNALQDIVGMYFPLPKLIRMLQNAGIDVFPAFDAFCYIENTCEKHWPMEKHLYFNMAQLGICFNFAWSRWNMTAGRRNIVLQMREYNVEKTKQKNHLMLHVTPLNAIYVDCTEVSQTFNEDGIENMKFYPDLFYLMKGTSSMAVKNKISKASKELIYALYELLMATRVVSFS